MTPASRSGHLLQNLIDLAAVGAAVVFIASYFPAAVMLSTTTTNGGDMGSHYYPAAYLRDVLLPRGKLTGWCPGNYCGYPLFQFYFPLPFLVMVALSAAIPLAIAFKLVSVLGTVLLPACGYLGLRLAGIPFPGPALGALGSLSFIFMEANSMWGGNIPSMLAGEFCFSMSLALAVIFVGALRRSMGTGQGWAWCGLLEGLVGLAHGYTLIWTGFTSLAEVVVTRGWWRRVGSLTAVHGLAILVMGFFLVPLVAYSGYTTTYSHVWVINSWREMLPPILWPAAGVAVASAVVVGGLSLYRREPFPRGLATVWTGTLLGILFYFTGHALNVVDIRFVPFFQLGLCLSAGAGLGYLFALLPRPEIWPVVGALAVLPYVEGKVTFIPSWIKWNYSGFEEKPTWPVFKGINDFVRGSFRDPRVVYEHASETESLGTVRAFEDLPLFSGRSTLEGLYMQSSPSAPFVFYIQSEISRDQSCPFGGWGCSRMNLARGVEHLKMFNVSQFIVRSPVVKAAAARHPGLEKQKTVGPYEIYRLRDNDGRYAIPLKTAPALVLTHSWKEAAYRWFKRAGPDDPVPVLAESASDEERRAFAAVFEELPAEIPRVPLADPPALREEMDVERITVTGCRPGQPVLMRVSYHPRWRSLTGERVWLAGPSFMLVFPKGERLDLVYGTPPVVQLGQLMTLTGWLVFAAAVLPPARRVREVTGGLGERVGAVSPVAAFRQWTDGFSVRVRRALVGAALAATLALFGVAAVAARTMDVDGVFRKGQDLYTAGKLEEAAALFHQAQQIAPLSYSAQHSTYFEAISLFRLERCADAVPIFQRLLENFPEAAAAAESLYHIGLCRARQGDVEGSVAAWQETRQRFPETPWAGYAGERLAEIKR